jgi:hypothetical protein
MDTISAPTDIISGIYELQHRCRRIPLSHPKLAASLDEGQALLKFSYDHADVKAYDALKFAERRLDHVMSDSDRGRIPDERIILEVQKRFVRSRVGQCWPPMRMKSQ